MSIQITYINNDGGGYCDTLNIASGITVDAFFKEKMPGREPENFMIRVNRQQTSRDQVLVANDRIAITPTKIDGASR